MPLSDRFELGRLLGRGTFGSTYLGRETATGRTVAIKCLPLVGLPEWKPVELFEREARVLRSLEHRGVPGFVDAFEDKDAQGGHHFYIVSEHIEGPTLQAEIARGRRWSPAQARALFTALLETLDYLHLLSPRVIHRDIKPGNIVLREGGQPVLVDFGSVRDLAARQGADGMTIAGTAGYMAPEQAMGLADVRSDLYGVGATMAHVLTHVHPSDLPRTGLRPRLGDLAGVDVALGRILERLLEPEPERRFASAAEVLRAQAGDGPGAGQLALRDGDREPSTSLAQRRQVDPTVALALLSEGPRAVVPEIETRLNYVRAMRGALPLSLGSMLGLMAIGVAAFAAGLPAVALPLVMLSTVAFALVPLTRRARDRRLYAEGSVTRGKILQARSENGPLYASYVFRHGGRDYHGYLLTNDAFIANRVGPDTPVIVFFDPDNPGRNAGLLPDELPADLRQRALEA